MYFPNICSLEQEYNSSSTTGFTLWFGARDLTIEGVSIAAKSNLIFSRASINYSVVYCSKVDEGTGERKDYLTFLLQGLL